MNVWERLRKASAQLDREVDELTAQMDNDFRTFWQACVGDRVKEMLECRAGADKCLTDEDSRVRQVAIKVLSWHWNARHEELFRSALERMGVQDPDVEVRETAIREIGLSYRGTDDVRVGRMLARMVYDEALAAELRGSAYRALLDLRWIPGPQPPPSDPLPPPLRIPEDIDWSLVDSFLVEGRTACPVDDSILLPEGIRELFKLAGGACSAYKRGEYWDAIGGLTEMIEAVPDAPGPYQKRGHAYLETGNLDAAIEDLTRSIELEPKSAVSYRFRSRAYQEKGMMELAERDAEKARELEGEQRPDSP